MSTHNIGFYEEISKNLSLNNHQINTLSLLLKDLTEGPGSAIIKWHSLP